MPGGAVSLRIVLILLLVVLVAPRGAGARPASRPPIVAWSFDIHDYDISPHGRVFLRVNGRNTLVVSKADMQYQTVPRLGYHERNIPAAALTACSGWWAGAGVDLYVVRRGGRLNVFLRDRDEQAPDTAYRLIKSVPILRR